MKTLDWLNNNIIGNGLLCDEYVEKVRNAKSKKQLFEVCADSNGVTFMAEMRQAGMPLDYRVIWEDFGRYINGKYKPVFEGGYSSVIYCQENMLKDVVVDTTLACFLGCILEVWVSKCNVTRIIVDQNSALKIYCPETSTAIVEVYGDGEVVVAEGIDRVKIKRK